MNIVKFRSLNLAALALAFGVFWAQPAVANTVAEQIADLPSSAQNKVNASIGAFVKAKVRVDRSANDLGWDCQAAARLVELGVEGARERLKSIADEIQNDAARSVKSGKPIGWSAVAERSAACVPAAPGARSKKATCEGQSTVYAFQTGLGMACMARAGALLQRPEYLKTAKDVMTYWDKLRQPEAGCKECVFFATSDSAGDDERYIRNMNLFVAFGAAELGRAANDGMARDLARRALMADIVDREAGNKGYLSKLDPIWRSRPGENDRIENHSAGVAVLLQAMYRSTGEIAADKQAQVVYRDWAGCTNKRCQTAGCKYWAGDAKQCQATHTASHCAFRKREASARAQCETYVELVPSVGSYGLWSVLDSANP